MRALLILGLCATAMVANARTAKTDTVNRYIINGQTINNFNGTQLQGKTVTSYNVATQNEKNRVVVTHTITIDGAKQNPAPSSSQNQKPSPMFKFEVKGNDGVSYVTEADMLKIVDGVVVDELPGPGNYISAKAWGPGSPEAKEFGEIGKNGVVIVRTKQIPTKILPEAAGLKILLPKPPNTILPIRIPNNAPKNTTYPLHPAGIINA